MYACACVRVRVRVCTMWDAEKDAPSIAPASAVFRDHTATTQCRGSVGVQHSVDWLASHADKERRSGSRVATLVGLGFDPPETAWYDIARQRATSRRILRAAKASAAARGDGVDAVNPVDIETRTRDAMAAAGVRKRTVLRSVENRRKARLEVDLGETNPAVAKGSATEKRVLDRVSAELATAIFPGGVYSHVTTPAHLASLDGEMELSRWDGSGVDRALAEFKSVWRPPRPRPFDGKYDLAPRPSYLVQCVWNMYVLGAGRPGGAAAAILGVGYIDDDKWVDASNRADVMAWRASRAAAGLPPTVVRIWTLFPDPELIAAILSVLQELDDVIDALLSAGVAISAESLRPWVQGALRASPRSEVLGVGKTHLGRWCVGLAHRWRRGPHLLEALGEDLPAGMAPSPAGPCGVMAPPRKGRLLARAFGP